MSYRDGVRQLISAAELGQVPSALEIFAQLRQELPKERFEKPFLWNLLLKACVEGKELRKALEIFEEVPRKSARSYGKLLAAAAKTLQLKEAERLGGLLGA